MTIERERTFYCVLSNSYIFYPFIRIKIHERSSCLWLKERGNLKGIAYAYLYKSQEKQLDHILLSDITLTFIRERKPIKLIKKLLVEKFQVEEKYPGIYYVSRDGYFPIQIIVSKQLDKENHIWLNALTASISTSTAEELVHITKQLTQLDDINYAESVWEIVAVDNREVVKNVWEGKGMIPRVLLDVFRPEIEEYLQEMASERATEMAKAEYDNGKLQVFKNMISRGFTKEEAQSIAEISDELAALALVQA